MPTPKPLTRKSAGAPSSGREPFRTRSTTFFSPGSFTLRRASRRMRSPVAKSPCRWCQRARQSCTCPSGSRSAPSTSSATVPCGPSFWAARRSRSEPLSSPDAREIAASSVARNATLSVTFSRAAGGSSPARKETFARTSSSIRRRRSATVARCRAQSTRVGSGSWSRWSTPLATASIAWVSAWIGSIERGLRSTRADPPPGGSTQLTLRSTTLCWSSFFEALSLA